MRTHLAKGCGRFVIIHIEKGEDLLLTIKKEIRRLGIENGAIVSGIGSLRALVYHRIADTEDNPTNEFITIKSPLELVSLQGLIVDFEPHLHFCCTDLNQYYGGHLENGSEVQYLAEIGIIEALEANVVRKIDEYGISYIDTKG